ncbi:MAG: HAD hydrolase family protein [Pirellula sp.]|jgi:YrbI family 3-deoxy-D-manno-octulosonate 8-phosphate phosphatase|nr:HAD hydrolase family protein [Pirellula sp.]
MAPRDTDLAKPIRFILSDVDGVLTDGSIVIDNAGVESKSFYVRDGHAIKLWRKAGFEFGLLTARNSQVVKLRAAELGIQMVRQGYSEKLPAAKEMMASAGVDPSEVCYIGDDLPDLSVMYEVGLSATVADAAPEVKQAARWVMQAPGGRGAVRELIERLLKAKSRWDDFIPNRLA